MTILRRFSNTLSTCGSGSDSPPASPLALGAEGLDSFSLTSSEVVSRLVSPDSILAPTSPREKSCARFSILGGSAGRCGIEGLGLMEGSEPGAIDTGRCGIVGFGLGFESPIEAAEEDESSLSVETGREGIEGACDMGKAADGRGRRRCLRERRVRERERAM